MNSRRVAAIIACLLMVLAFAGAHAWTPTRHMADMRPKVDLETMFPKAFGDWRIDTLVPVQLISPDQAAVLNQIYNQTLARTYVNGKGERIMLSVAYGGDQSDATRAHRPEVCYPAQGFQILSSRNAVLHLPEHDIRAKRLVAKLGGRVEPITYWTTVGERVALSGTEQKLAQLSYSTRGIVPDGMLVRVSSIDDDTADAFRIQQRFVAALAAAIPRDLQPQVIGRAAHAGSSHGSRNQAASQPRT